MSPPSAKQIALAVRIAAELGETLPRAARSSAEALSVWIEDREARYKASTQAKGSLPKTSGGWKGRRRGLSKKPTGARMSASGRVGVSGAVAEAIYAKHLAGKRHG